MNFGSPLQFDAVAGHFILDAPANAYKRAKFCGFQYMPQVGFYVKPNFTPSEWQRFRRVFPSTTIDPELYDDLRLFSQNHIARMQDVMDAEYEPVIWRGIVLHPYQDQGIAFLQQGRRVILGDSMGLGKTIQAIAAANAHVENGGNVLIVAPKMVIPEWTWHIQQFASYPQHWHVVSYDYARKNASDMIRYGDSSRTVLILDEASYAKNWKSGRAQAVMQMADACRYVWMLTATPIRSNIGESFPLLYMARPYQFRERGANFWSRTETAYWAFVREWAYTYTTSNRGVIVGGLRKEKRDAFHHMIKPFFLRRTNDELNLPELQRRIVRVDMPAKQRRAYTEAEKGFLLRLQNGEESLETISGDFASVTRLRQLSASLRITQSGEESGKLKWLEEWYEINGDEHKTIVFCAYVDMVEQIAEELGSSAGDVATLHGHLTKHQTERNVNEFKTNDRCRMLVCTYDSAAFGLNLQAADVVVWTTLPWTPDTREQGTARAWRQGQTRDVQEIVLIHPGTIDEAVLRTLKRKQTIFNQAFAVRASVEELLDMKGGN